MAVRIGSYLRANVLGVIAIFIALCAGAYAVEIAPRNSVVSKSIRNGQVKTRDLAAGAVKSAKVADESLTGADVANGSLSGDDVDESTLEGLLGPNTVGTEEVINDSLRIDDFGPNVGVGTDPAAIGDGKCTAISGLVVQGVQPGDPLITSTIPEMPVGVIVTAQVAAAETVEIQICNLTGAQFDPPNGSYLFSALRYE